MTEVSVLVGATPAAELFAERLIIRSMAGWPGQLYTPLR